MNINKKLLLEIIIPVVAVAIAGWFIYDYYKDKGEKDHQLEEKNRQMEELAALRAQSGDQPLTEEQKDAQSAQLDKIKKETISNPLSDEEKTKQLEALNNLRSSQ